jgi:uncharacterized protein GlcG (DUF336 family)
MQRGKAFVRAFGALTAIGAVACGGGGGSGSGSRSGFLGGSGIPGMAATRACAGNCDPGEALNEQQVMTMIDQGARELQARGVPGVIAVVDRVGNPLAVWASDGEPLSILITTNRPAAVQVPVTSLQNGFENTLLPAEFGAISKAITGAFLSSQGNAFSTRTANDIIGSNFPPGNGGQMSGPLFGVQFSQLPCGDWVRRDDPMLQAGGIDAFDNVFDGRAGPKRSPLGFSADPGGFPLYINGVIVGGIGVTVQETTMVDATGRTVPVSIYGVQGRRDSAGDLEEQIALSASRGFEAPDNRIAATVAVMGRLLRYTNTASSAKTERAAALVTALPTGGSLKPVPGFYDGTQVFPGVRVGMPESGIVLASGGIPGGPAGFGVDRTGRQIRAQILVTPDGLPFLGRNSGPVTNPRGSISPPAGVGLTADEVRSILDRSLGVAQEARAQIRQPNGSSVHVNVHICDRDGNELGYASTPDAPLFGSDVALQKCRAAAIFSRGSSTAPPGSESSPTAADMFASEDQFFVQQGRSKAGQALGIPNGVRNVTMGRYLQRFRDFIPRPGALADGVAFSNRAIGLLARPCFPDGVNCTPDFIGGVRTSSNPGPLSVDGDPRKFSPLANGFQLEYVKDYVLDGVLGRSMNIPEPSSCGTLSANGFQIFAGGEPIFKREVDAAGNLTGRTYLVGGIGISGDGIDQDDMVGFLGVDRASRLPNSRVLNAPIGTRADRLQPRFGGGSSLRYVNCPTAPFNDPFEDEQNACEGR